MHGCHILKFDWNSIVTKTGGVVIPSLGLVILRVCDFFNVAKNRCCKQNSYGSKMAKTLKKSQPLSEAKDLVSHALIRKQVLRFAQDDK
jgi:hypothetical protein